jgi:dehydrogenase/reductase SDR family protein 12
MVIVPFNNGIVNVLSQPNFSNGPSCRGTDSLTVRLLPAVEKRRNTMLNLKETIRVTCPPQEAFAYLADFANIQQWDASVLAARQITEGPPRVGTRFRLRLQFGGRPVPMDYCITELAAPHRLVLQGSGASFMAEDRITIEPAAEGTRIAYEADIGFTAPWGKTIEALAGPLVRRGGRRAAQRLQRCLSGGGPPPRLTLTTRMVDQAILPGVIGFTRLGYRLGRHRWPLAARPLDGRTVVLTGGTSGIGRATAFQLVRLGARLVLVGRSMNKTEAVARELRGAGGEVVVEIADLALMADIRALARRIAERLPAVHVLINNAGALFTQREMTAEGIEKTLATDLLGPFLLTRALLPCLAAGRPSRIVNVSSGGMYTRGIDLDNLDSARGVYNGAEAYARAKRGLVMLTELWAEALAAMGISVHAMHPGWVDTPGLERSLTGFHQRMQPWLRTPGEGADTITWLAASSEAGRTSGLFWRDRLPRATHVFPGTKASPRDRRELFRKLAGLERSTR